MRADAEILKRLRGEHQRLTTKPYESVYIEVQGRLAGKSTGGFAANYDGDIIVERIVVIRPAESGDCDQ